MSGVRAPTPLMNASAPGVRAPTPLMNALTPGVRAPTPLMNALTPGVRAPTPLMNALTPGVRAPAPLMNASAPGVRAPTPLMNAFMRGVRAPAAAPASAVMLRSPRMQAQQRATSALKPQERLIVALDVPTRHEALQLANDLRGLISFYKVGLELLMSGGMEELLQSLLRENHVFVDLKLPGDIPETVRRVVDVAARMGVSFITLSNSVTPGTVRTAADGRAGRANPQLLYVSFLSSLDRSDFAEQYERDGSEFDSFLEERTAKAKTAGADGFIVSGQEIGLLRKRYPDALLVSPGIRPAGASRDDHKRSCTPSEAIRLGADYIVVGRPIRDASNRKDAAKRIVDEITTATSV